MPDDNTWVTVSGGGAISHPLWVACQRRVLDKAVRWRVSKGWEVKGWENEALHIKHR